MMTMIEKSKVKAYLDRIAEFEPVTGTWEFLDRRIIPETNDMNFYYEEKLLIVDKDGGTNEKYVKISKLYSLIKMYAIMFCRDNDLGYLCMRGNHIKKILKYVEHPENYVIAYGLLHEKLDIKNKKTYII